MERAELAEDYSGQRYILDQKQKTLNKAKEELNMLIAQLNLLYSDVA